MLACLGFVGGQLHPAGLAAPADQDLRLDDHRVADLVRRGHRILDGRDGLAVGHLQAVTGEELLALILKKVHWRCGCLGRGYWGRACPPPAKVHCGAGL